MSAKLKEKAIQYGFAVKIKNALELFDIKLLDHIIVAKNNGYYSFADEQII